MKKNLPVVVGIDFTQCSRFALSIALRVAAMAKSDLHAVHVVDRSVVSSVRDAYPGKQAGLTEALISDALSEWREFVRRLPLADGKTFEAVVGERVTAFLDAAKAREAGLVVIGAYGSRPAPQGTGTVASACVRKSDADVLLVRDTRPGPIQTVVAAVDFSETSQRALRRAAQFATMDAAHLVVYHHWELRSENFLRRSWRNEAAPGQRAETENLLRRRLIEFSRPVLAEFPRVAADWETECLDGHRGGIVSFARDVGADLVVLGTRGHTNLRYSLLGSTAEKTLQETRCSVLAVKPQRVEPQPKSDISSERVVPA
jgi:nucleotide-binding universal stress UspA family protein